MSSHLSYWHISFRVEQNIRLLPPDFRNRRFHLKDTPSPHSKDPGNGDPSHNNEVCDNTDPVATSLWGIDESDGGFPRDGYRTCGKRSNSGEGVHVWILDTGCKPKNGGFCHQTWPTPMHGSCKDVHGHGSHVAATATDEDYGLAYNARRSCIKILGGSGGSIYSAVQGICFAIQNRGQLENGDVINLSIQTASASPSLNAAAEAASRRGMYVSVAAGNYEMNACNSSPASAQDERIFTVQAHDENGNPPKWTNFATPNRDCTHLSAPGVNILSLDHTSRAIPGYGTSMAAPHVTGAIANLLSDEKDIDLGILTAKGRMIDMGPGKVDKPSLGLACC